jgi:hypothetical protein
VFTRIYPLATFPVGPLSMIPSVPKQVVAGTMEPLSRGVFQSVRHLPLLPGTDTWSKCGEQFSSRDTIAEGFVSHAFKPRLRMGYGPWTYFLPGVTESHLV